MEQDVLNMPEEPAEAAAAGEAAILTALPEILAALRELLKRIEPTVGEEPGLAQGQGHGHGFKIGAGLEPRDGVEDEIARIFGNR